MLTFQNVALSESYCSVIFTNGKGNVAVLHLLITFKLDFFPFHLTKRDAFERQIDYIFNKPVRVVSMLYVCKIVQGITVEVQSSVLHRTSWQSRALSASCLVNATKSNSLNRRFKT